MKKIFGGRVFTGFALKEYINSEFDIFRYLHGVPYDIWEKGDKEYDYDIGFSSEEKDVTPYMVFYTKDDT